MKRTSLPLHRREFIAGLGSAAAWPVGARAQAAKKVPRLCFLTFDPVASRSSTRFGAFFDALRDLGYADGDTIAIDYLSADGHGERFPRLVLGRGFLLLRPPLGGRLPSRIGDLKADDLSPLSGDPHLIRRGFCEACCHQLFQHFDWKAVRHQHRLRAAIRATREQEEGAELFVGQLCHGGMRRRVAGMSSAFNVRAPRRQSRMPCSSPKEQ